MRANGPSGEDFDGPWYRLNNFAVPNDVGPESQELWANIMYYDQNDDWPTYGDDD